MNDNPAQSHDLAASKLPAAQHTDAIEQLAEDTAWPVHVVAEMYWSELTLLQEDATVDTYLSLLTSRKVRETLRHAPPV
jgi:hypothetical protein